MAKRRKPTVRRRRRVSGIGSASKMSTMIYVIGGALAAQAITKFLPAGMDSKIKAAIPIVAGFLAPRFVRGAGGAGLSAGLVAVGGLNLIQDFGVLSGIGQTPMIAMYNGARRLNGVETERATPQVAGISGLHNIRTLAALEEG